MTFKNSQQIINRSKNNKLVCLQSSVLVEKSNFKEFIINSERFLNNIGIAIYFPEFDFRTLQWPETENLSYAALTNKENLDKLLEILDIQKLVQFYKSALSNARLSYLPHKKYNTKHLGVRVDLQMPEFNNMDCLAFCINQKTAKSAGYSIID